MIRFLFALILVGVCFVLYLGTLEIRDINKRIKDLDTQIGLIQEIYRLQQQEIVAVHESTDKYAKSTVQISTSLQQRVMNLENNVARVKIEQRRALNQSVYDNGFVDIEELKKEVEEEYDEEN